MHSHFLHEPGHTFATLMCPSETSSELQLHGQQVRLPWACHPRICASILAAVCFLGGFHTFLVTDSVDC